MSIAVPTSQRKIPGIKGGGKGDKQLINLYQDHREHLENPNPPEYF